MGSLRLSQGHTSNRGVYLDHNGLRASFRVRGVGAQTQLPTSREVMQLVDIKAVQRRGPQREVKVQWPRGDEEDGWVQLETILAQAHSSRIQAALSPTPEQRHQINARYTMIQRILLEAFDTTIQWVRKNIGHTVGPTASSQTDR